MQRRFELVSSLTPKGSQPQAIAQLVKGFEEQKKAQVLLGITGSGKTFTMAHVIEKVQMPTLVLAHNKTLAAQLYEEFKTFFPNNAVEYFVSYYDYYQPEVYIARTDTYIEKDLAINERIDKMRLSATRSLLERNDVIIVSSVSCIYGLGLPEYYIKMKLSLKVGQEYHRDDLLLRLVQMQYQRNDYDFARATFRVRGDVVEVYPAYEEDLAVRIEFFGDEIERLSEFDPLTGSVLRRLEEANFYPSSHHVTPEDVQYRAMQTIQEELKLRAAYFEAQDKFIEHQRIMERTKYDLEMIKEMGFCKGIENYSRHFTGRDVGEPPPTLLEYFPKDFLFIIDESHQTIPQLHAMYNGDRARKAALVEYGFRLPSAYDNRPLKFSETYTHFHHVVYVSATPGEWEIAEAKEAGGEVIEQIIRPTGLLDPVIEIRPALSQVDDALGEIRHEIAQGGRVLVTVLTKRLAEELTTYLVDLGVKAKYLHADIDTLERIQIIKELRLGEFDVLVGINLLREGLDIPEVTLVMILDADKEGFLRSETSLIQTCGRAARNSKGRVVMYADKQTQSIQNTLRITQERRAVQEAYNKEHGIVPTTTIRSFTSLMDEEGAPTTEQPVKKAEKKAHHYTKGEVERKIAFYEKQMKAAAKKLQFEEAAAARDQMHHFQNIAMTLF